MSYFDNYQNHVDKLADVLSEHSLAHKFDRSKYPITLTISQDVSIEAQMALYTEADGSLSSRDAVLRFIFKMDSLEIQTNSRLVISDKLMNKIKGLAKKMHYSYLQAFFAERMQGGEDCDRESTPDDDADPDEDDASFDGFYEASDEDGAED